MELFLNMFSADHAAVLLPDGDVLDVFDMFCTEGIWTDGTEFGGVFGAEVAVMPGAFPFAVR